MTEIMHYIRRKIGGKAYWFDKTDEEFLLSSTWTPTTGDYLRREVDDKKQYFHRVLLNVPKGMVVDHINGNTRDNRRCNLRVCTQHQNTYNQKVRKNNTSGYKGVYFHKTNKKWCAFISVPKSKYLGSFETKEEAARAYDKVARELHGGFARLNFPEESC